MFRLLEMELRRGSSLEARNYFFGILVNCTLDSRMDVAIIVSVHTLSALLLNLDKMHKVLNFSVGGGRLALCSNWRP